MCNRPVPFERDVTLGVDRAASDTTEFIIINHPTGKGLSDSYFDSIGRHLGARLDPHRLPHAQTESVI